MQQACVKCAVFGPNHSHMCECVCVNVQLTRPWKKSYLNHSKWECVQCGVLGRQYVCVIVHGRVRGFVCSVWGPWSVSVWCLLPAAHSPYWFKLVYLSLWGIWLRPRRTEPLVITQGFCSACRKGGGWWSEVLCLGRFAQTSLVPNSTTAPLSS